MMTGFDWKIRVYYEDTDAGGVVYHSRYLNFFERARTEWLRECGFSQSQLVSETGILFVVSGMEIDFVKPAKLDDMLRISVELTRLGAASMRLSQSLWRERDGKLLTSARVRVACLDAASFSPVRIPETLRKELNT